MEDILNVVRREAARVAQRGARPSIGTIDSYDPKTHTAKVKLMPEGVISGWLPIATPAAGGGAGYASGPNIGDQVMVQFHEADREAGVVMGFLYSDQDKALGVPSGEFWIAHKSGSVIKLLANGDVAAKVAGKSTTASTGDIVLKSDGKVYLGGDPATDTFARVSTESGPSANVYAKI